MKPEEKVASKNRIMVSVGGLVLDLEESPQAYDQAISFLESLREEAKQ